MIRAISVHIINIAWLAMAGLVAGCSGGPRDPEQPFFNYGTVCPTPGMYYGSSYCQRTVAQENVARPGYCYRTLGRVDCFATPEPYYDPTDRSSPPVTVTDPKAWPPNPAPPPVAMGPSGVPQGAIQPSATAPIAPVTAQPLPPLKATTTP
jgi:hypothetical protein